MSGTAIHARMGGIRKGDAALRKELGPRTVDAIAEDSNCIYLTVTAATNERTQTRIFCMVPTLTNNIHSLVTREPLYLTTSQFNTKEEALRNAQSWRKKVINHPKFSEIDIQTWAYDSTAYSRTFYYVVVTHTMDIIRKRQVSELIAQLNTPLRLVNSSSFSVPVQGTAKVRKIKCL